MNNKEITVYWSPSPYLSDQESWSLPYSEPVSVLNELRSKQNKDKGYDNMFSCPAISPMFKNIFTIKHPFGDVINIPDMDFNVSEKQYINSGSILAVYVPRKTSLEGYVNIQYNMAWLFFADEPVVARFTAPYMPVSTPAAGSILAAGEFDIGSWYRPFNLDYHVPNNIKKLVFEKNQALYNIEIKTDKPVVFKRYSISSKLQNLAIEMSQSPVRYGKFIPLSEKYETFKKSKIREQILTEIKKNLVE